MVVLMVKGLKTITINHLCKMTTVIIPYCHYIKGSIYCDVVMITATIGVI